LQKVNVSESTKASSAWQRTSKKYIDTKQSNKKNNQKTKDKTITWN